MRTKFIVIISLLLCSLSVSAQDAYYSIYSFSYFIPRVELNNRTASLQSSLLPNIYRTRSADSDIRWVAAHDSSLVEFWQNHGDTLLHVLRELSGIEWYETEFDIYLVRYYPGLGAGDPTIIPVGGISRGIVLEAAPGHNSMILNLALQLSHRMLSQAVRPADDIHLTIADHPLMLTTSHRREMLAMLLAVSACQSVIGLDSTRDAYRSAFWKRQFRPRILFEKYLFNRWVLTPDNTLADWLAGESRSSELVGATRPPRRQRRTTMVSQSFVEGMPVQGIFGFSVRQDDVGRLAVGAIDPYRLAYACGLSERDIIRRVDGKLVRTAKGMIESIIQGYDNGGAVLQVVRNRENIEIIIQPMMLPTWEDDFYFDDYLEEEADSISVDSLDDDSDW